MSISPVQSYSSTVDAASANTAASQPQPRPQAKPKVDEPPQTSPPGSGYGPTEEETVKKDVPPASQVPEDEVQLQRESDLENQLIVRYVDKAGNLILQIPARQVLDFERAVAAEFEHERPATTTEGSSRKGGSNGY